MSSFLGIDLSQNLSYYAVPAAFFCAHSGHIYTVLFAGRAYDNADPLALKDNIAKSQTLTKNAKEHFIRAKRASENGYETIGLFAAAVAAANAAHVRVPVLNAMAWGYVAVRIAFNFVYINLGGIRKTHPLRSLLWVTSIFLSLGLFIAAGRNSASGGFQDTFSFENI